MRIMKKFLASLLVVSMLVGSVPASAMPVEAATGNVIDEAIFCSDVHGNSSNVSSAFNGIKNVDSTFNPSTATFVGDTQMAASNVTTAAKSVYSNIACYYAYGNHDSEGNYGISDVTGLLYGDSTTNYYIYAISQTSMASSNPDTSGFTSTIEGLDKSKPLFIASHLPLHDRRGDSNGAEAWYEAISAAAEQMDIVFFWAHNHTGENEVDKAAFYVAKDGEETITLENTSTVVTPNFTYMNAGFVGKSSSRGGVVSTVKIYEDSLVFQDYTSSGVFTGEYSHNVEVAREFASVDSETTEPQEKTLSSIAITTEPTKTSYTVGDTFTTEGMVVIATYSDGSTEPVTEYTVSEVDMTTAGTKIVTVSYEDKTATFEITVSVASEDDNNTNTDDEDTSTDNNSSNSVTITGEGGTKTVYVLSDSLTANGEYLIVNTNTAGDGYALLNNSGSVSSVGVTVFASDSGNYIELDNSNAVWTATTKSSGFELMNGSYYLEAYGNSSAIHIETSREYSSRYWNYSSSQLGYYGGNSTHYIMYSNGFASQKSSGTIYIYEKQTISASTDVTYTMRAEDVSRVVDANDASSLTTTLDYCLQGNGSDLTTLPSGGSYSFEEIADVDGIISSISEDGVITFSGNIGESAVKVAYTWTQNDKTYTVYRNITVKATAPYYTINLHKADLTEAKDLTEFADGVIYYTYNSKTNTYQVADTYVAGTTYYTTPVEQGDEITDVVALKGIEAGDTYSVWAVVKTHTSANPDGTDMGELGEALHWTVSDTSIATIDEDTGLITFTGQKYGTFDVTVAYTGVDGKVVTDIITISVTKSLYTVPEDGTDDFPEYPNQGSIRYDKTATAVGNFSQTGIANVELSMTGVPYGTSEKTDVVVMVDMTASMSDDDVTAAELAVQELIGSLVYDEENDQYDSNIQLFVDTFGSGSSDSAVTITNFHDCTTISNADELTAAKNAISFSQSSQGGGTRYNIALADVYATLNREGHADNQFVVFVSDGVATAYSPLTNGAQGTTITGSNSETSSLCAGWFDDTGAVTDDFETEYYTYMIKTAGIPVYTVGANLTALSDAADLLNHMSSNYSPDGKTSTGETKYSFFCTTSGGITDEVLKIFHGIGQDIKEAATNVVVEDKIADEYTMTFALPSGVTAEEAGMDDFYIQVVGYELDDNNERKENPTVLEKILFNSDGTITHTIGATTCGDTCTHVTKTDGIVTAIDGTYFEYSSTTEGEFITWKADKLDRTELALQYFVYLDNSAGDVEAGNQVDPGTYPTNEYATLTYTNFNGTECQQEFPVPSLTWKGAHVSYVFYLVNENGEPVNRAGRVVPFAEAVYVTDPVRYEVTWNNDEGAEKLDASYLAKNYVPDVYALYDQNAYYEVLVYQTEGVDSETNAHNYNHFIIEGSASGTENTDAGLKVTNLETTKVFNTKAGNRYDDYGAYSETAGTYTSSKSKTSYTATVTKDIDYANTTVAFAVVWKPELVEDTVVVDYGLDVVVDVYENDGLAAGVTGVSLTAPTGVTINEGTYGDTQKVGSASIESSDGLWTASKESLTSVRFTQNKMGLKEPAKFYYEAGVNYYTYDANNDATLNTTNMYSSVTVIPATTIYYEDDFVRFTTEDSSGNPIDNAWTTVGTTKSATQDVDRPGVTNSMNEDYDANNLYGYDSAYADSSLHSLGSSQAITVDSSMRGVATFDFYGTGFDIVGLTDKTTGTLIVQVFNEAGESVKTSVVDTYYGYAYEDGEWKPVDSNSPNALYQVPVMKISGLTYGKYTAKLTAGYNSYFDHTSDENGDYTLYVDAIRIYDPANDGATSDVVKDAYEADGELYPEYTELRDKILSSYIFADDAIYTEADVSKGFDETVTYYVLNEENKFVEVTVEEPESGVAYYVQNSTVNGVVFIDGATSAGAGNTANIADYKDYGPNNEVYLQYNQAIAFDLKAAATTTGEVSTIQLAIKSVGGTGKVEVYGVDAEGNKTTALAKPISTATDMYYDIKDLNGKTVVIKNTGDSDDATISITNIKTTYTAAQPETASYNLLSVSRASVNAALLSLCEDPVINSVKTNKSSYTVKDTVKATIKTNVATEYITVNGEKITEFEEKDGERIWTYSVKTTKTGSLKLKVVAYNEMEEASEEVVKTVSVKKFAPKTFKLSLNKKKVIVGEKVKATVTTSTDVKYVTINGKKITKYTSKNGTRTWTLEVKATKSGKMTFKAVAYNTNESASNSISKTATAQKFAPKTFKLSSSKYSVKKGQKYTVTVKTSTDVKYVTINGKKITKYTSNSAKTTRTFKVTYTAKTTGKKTVKAVAFNKNGSSSNAKTITVTVKK